MSPRRFGVREDLAVLILDHAAVCEVKEKQGMNTSASGFPD
jgi:hypothetical protein